MGIFLYWKNRYINHSSISFFVCIMHHSACCLRINYIRKCYWYCHQQKAAKVAKAITHKTFRLLCSFAGLCYNSCWAQMKCLCYVHTPLACYTGMFVNIWLKSNYLKVHEQCPSIPNHSKIPGKANRIALRCIVKTHFYTKLLMHRTK